MSGMAAGVYPWQDRQWQELIARWREGRLPHALLLSGSRGMGKRRFAGVLARAMLCESPHEDGAPCGRCRACELVAAGSHPDLLHVHPEEEGKQITVEQARTIAAFQALKSHYGGPRVVILGPADRMNINAANALLKTLEEPASGTVLLLYASEPALLLPTIRSRCQQVAFRNAGGPAVRWLREELGGEGGDPEVLLAMAGGAPLAARDLIREGHLELRQVRLEELESLASGRTEPVVLAAAWLGDGAPQALRWLNEWLGDMVRLKSAPGAARLRHPDLRDRLQGLAERLDLAGLYRLLDKSQDALRLVHTQVNTQLLLEDLLLAWVLSTKQSRPAISTVN